MSEASPVQCTTILNPSSFSSWSYLGFSTSKRCVLIIRCSQTENPLRRPSAPPTLREASPPQNPVPPTPSSSASPPPLQKAVAVDGKSVVTASFRDRRPKSFRNTLKLEAAGEGGLCLVSRSGCLQNMQQAPALLTKLKSFSPTSVL
ncbi:unnamed protein product [Eruca vesicaria subsp. sativa]|uniref:Uncharacterized protein n=1 Tax=Eruca vesicaria subsp. sativa TaxID=29727 RepID=A0ABC8KDM4_ERUVS|nr:unnamed protein product [Eruca vesicaria subsp. sativa]